MSNTPDYKLTTMPEFPSELLVVSPDVKNRISVPSEFVKVIRDRNAFYLSSIVDGNSRFDYRFPHIYYLGRPIARLNPPKKEDVENGKDLVEISVGGSPETVDISGINRKLTVFLTYARKKPLLMAYPFFDWHLRMTDIENGPVNDLYDLIVSNDYCEVPLDKQGRVTFTRFLDELDIDDEVGFTGFDDAIIISNPDYLMRPLSKMEHILKILKDIW